VTASGRPPPRSLWWTLRVSVRELRVVVVAEDYDTAVRFYRDVLGLRERAAVPGPGGAEVAILEAGRATVEIANPAQRDFIDEVEVGRRGVSPRIRLAFEVEDVAGATAALKAGGATEVAPPTPTPFHSVNARLDTPGDLQITLFEPDRRPPAAGTSGDLVIRDAEPADWTGIWPFFREIVAAGETYTWPRDMAEDAARAAWFPSPGRTVVALLGGTVVGSAKTQPNHAGPGAHIANASFMVDPAYGGRGIGRALGEHVLTQARADGYRAMQFNAVVASNAGAVRLWSSLGFTVVGAVPAAFDHPRLGPVPLLIMHRSL
jgi:L-amino acid N-acyltransferase YncA/predicted enzyme related to lactoylglutathione lyase